MICAGSTKLVSHSKQENVYNRCIKNLKVCEQDSASTSFLTHFAHLYADNKRFLVLQIYSIIYYVTF